MPHGGAGCDVCSTDRKPHRASPLRRHPHTVKRMWFMASRWSAPLHERPGCPEPNLLCLARSPVDGVESPTPATTCWRPEAAAPPSRCWPIPRRRHRFDLRETFRPFPHARGALQSRCVHAPCAGLGDAEKPVTPPHRRQPGYRECNGLRLPADSQGAQPTADDLRSLICGAPPGAPGGGSLLFAARVTGRFGGCRR